MKKQVALISLCSIVLSSSPFLLRSTRVLAEENKPSQSVVIKTLEKEKEGKTVVLVSHRQSTMSLADRIYEMEKGRVS